MKMTSEILWRLLSVLFILIVCAVFFFLGRAYEESRMKGLKDELKTLRNKLKDGEDMEERGDYLPPNFETIHHGDSKDA